MSAEYEIDMSIPVASEIQPEESSFQPSEEPQAPLTLEQVKEYLPHLEPQELLDLQDSINTLLKKKWKTAASGGKSTKSKAVPSDKPKKPASKALLRTQAWIAYVLRHSTENGWEAFQTRQETKNKVTGEKEVEVTERSGSKPNSSEDPDFQPYTYKNKETGEILQPAHVFEDTGKHLTYKDAMTLIAILKWKEGAKPESLKSKSSSEEEERPHWSDLYVQFLEEYEASHPSSDPSGSSGSADSDASGSPSGSATSSPKVVRLTAAEKEEERARKRQIVEEEKEQRRQAKEEEKKEKEAQKQREKEEKEAKKQQEKEEKEAKKRQEKEEKEAQKQREKEEKEAQKLAKKSPVPSAAIIKKSPVPVAKASTASTSTTTTSKASTSTTTTSKATPAPVTKTLAPAKSAQPAKPAPSAPSAPAAPPAQKPAPKQLKKKEEEKMTWSIPEDGLVHEWTFQGTTYLVNSQKAVWKMDAEGNPGDWVGLVILEENRIDTTVPEPEYTDDEDEQ